MNNSTYNTYSDFEAYDPPMGAGSGSGIPDAEAVGILLLFMFFGFIVFAVTYVLVAIFMMRIFKKAGTSGAAAWIPIFNSWRFLEIGGKQGFWAILALFPVIGIVSAVFMCIAAYNIGLKLGKSGGFVALYILLTPVWLVWLAVDSSTWDESRGEPSLAPLKSAGQPPHTMAPSHPIQPHMQAPAHPQANPTPQYPQAQPGNDFDSSNFNGPSTP